jgi:hypothetical protein
MRKDDARKLDHKTLEALRNGAVRGVQAGESPAAVARALRRSLKPRGELRLFFLPPYAPDRNPDALAGKHLEADTIGRKAVTGKDDFQRTVLSSLRQLQNDTTKNLLFLPESFQISPLLMTRAPSFPRKLEAL